MSRLQLMVVLLAVAVLAACGGAQTRVLTLATTTSTDDSGLLAELVPDFEARFGVRVDVVAVGTGQAMALGEAGDADVILVHSRAREDAFLANGHGTSRSDVMYNDFVLVGPASDPAGVGGLTLARRAFAAIALAEAPFASRGDDSGTHSKELSIWSDTGIQPDPRSGWYDSLGQGMGSTLSYANETGSYTLSDRGTFLSQRENLPNLRILVGGSSVDGNADPSLLNPYSVIPVSPAKGGIEEELASEFAEWLTSVETQEAIAAFGVDTFGQPLFYPASPNWIALGG